MYCLFCVVLCIVCVYMCTVLLPPVGYPIAVKYIISICHSTSHDKKTPLMNKNEWTVWLLNILVEPISCHETSVTDYQLTLRSEDLIYTAAEDWNYEFRYFTLTVTTSLIGSVNESKHKSAIHITLAVLATRAAGPKLRMLKSLKILFCNKIIRLMFKINSVVKELDRRITVWW